MHARFALVCGFALATAPLLLACAPDVMNRLEYGDGSAPDGASGSHDSGGTSHGDASSDTSSSGDPDSAVVDEDSGATPRDAGNADASAGRDAGCVRPPYKTTDQCSGIGQPNGPRIPSCSKFDANGTLKCPSIPGCNVVPDPSGTYCKGDGVQCDLSDCGHICKLPDWEPCYDVATGECLEAC
jgi:hypothetical protein